MGEPDPVFFDGPEALRAWFDAHAAASTEVWVGFRRVTTGGGAIPLSWPQAVDEALCVGWIDVQLVDDSARGLRIASMRRAGDLAGDLAGERRADGPEEA
jgi:uncharacterized protein YdeI (YjbR/CyaY-like superfamily)